MRLKRLELFGFKSFADRTRFEFEGDSLTGVVGPNGCGKSNVVDAIRWALGETRPTSMRGGEMTDVIFKGSSSRPALSVAEVTVTVDNASGGFVGRGAEVAITRRVFLSGEGEYLIDGEKVRLKDVRELLFDTGLGSRGYSVLEQGRIDAVLSANPLERRRIFEEAAGISRYRQRRQETELRLKRVADDLARLDDLLGELGTRVRSLKIQAGKAERWASARSEWLAARARHARHGLYFLGRTLEELGLQTRALESRAAELRAARDSAGGERALRERERASQASELDRAVQDAARLTGESRATDEKIGALRARALEAAQAAEHEDRRVAELAAALEARRAESRALGTALVALEAAAREAAGNASAAAAELASLETRAGEHARALAERGGARLALLEERTQAQNRIAALEGAEAQARERDARQSARLGEARNAAETQRGELYGIEQRFHRSAAELEACETARRALAQSMADAAQRAQSAEAEKKASELERASLASRADVLLARERDLEELQSGAKRVLSETQAAGGPLADGALVGLLADHLRADSAHARALEAALADRDGALVVRDRAALERALAWIAEREAGRAGLVLPTALATREARVLPRADARVLGPLADFVHCADEFRPLVAALFANVVLVRDLSAALALATEHPELVFVTPEGARADAAGASGGRRAAQLGPVARRSSAAELRAQAETLAERIAALEERRAKHVNERLALQRDWERSSAELERLRGARMQAESALATARARGQDQAALCSELEQEGRAEEQRSAARAEELATARAALARANEAHGLASEAHAALETEQSGLDQERGRAAAAASLSRERAAQTRAEHEGEARRAADLARVLTDGGRELDRARGIVTTERALAERCAAEIETLSAQSAELLEARAESDERLRVLRAMLATIAGGIEGAQGRESRLSRELEELAARQAELGLAAQREALARAEIARRAQEELGQGEAELLQAFEPEPELADAKALDAVDREARELREKLEKLGPVNVEALGELEEAAGRLEFLERQRADLASARTTLDQTIGEIDVESRRLFLETFEAVRGNFQRIFRQLFGGGKADVHLQEGVDSLESGVEILARPPGRELLPIGLLSGGQRTLTALALLFAVFEARPSPFCVLDEVDAALDDVNVGRFLAMLDGYRASTQFVIVTHNKITMSACQRLYGVTMETKGVSRQVSVELDEAERWAGAPPVATDDENLRTHVLVPHARAANGNGGPSRAETEPQTASPT